MNLKKIVGILIIAWLIITLSGGLSLRNTLNDIPKANRPVKEENTSRIAFFSDIHFQKPGEVQTDIGAPSSEIPKNTRKALTSVKPDYIFNSGDMTAHTEPDEWKAYAQWIENFEAPVFEIFGNHDRDHHPNIGTYGNGYYRELENRYSGTKVLKLGNNIFILVSEEHNPEFDNNNLASTIPQKRFEFIEEYVKKYSESNNIFIMNHTPLSGTTAFSRTWFYGLNKNWIHLTNEFLTLLDNYNVTAHISGHIHTDYRWRDEPGDTDGTTGVENLSKFVNGEEITSSARLHAPYRLPDTYFLNMPAADFAHGWGSRFYSIAFPEGNPTTKTTGEQGGPVTEYEEYGPKLTDILHNEKTSKFLGRGAVYYADFTESQSEIEVTTRWASGNADVEKYEINLDHPIRLGNEKIRFIASDLSLRKKDNITITRDNWFKIKAGKTGTGVFSKRFGENEELKEKRISIENNNLDKCIVAWEGKESLGGEWQPLKASDNLSKIEAVRVEILFKAADDKDAYVEDINLSD